VVPSPSARRLHRGVRAQELPLPLRGGAGRRGGGAPGDDVGAARARAAWRAARRQGEDAAYDAHDEDRDEDPEARCAPAPDAAIAIVFSADAAIASAPAPASERASDGGLALHQASTRRAGIHGIALLLAHRGFGNTVRCCVFALLPSPRSIVLFALQRIACRSRTNSSRRRKLRLRRHSTPRCGRNQRNKQQRRRRRQNAEPPDRRSCCCDSFLC
jgi:hypothetical protein